jgi:hypothetical protein
MEYRTTCTFEVNINTEEDFNIMEFLKEMICLGEIKKVDIEVRK